MKTLKTLTILGAAGALVYLGYKLAKDTLKDEQKEQILKKKDEVIDFLNEKIPFKAKYKVIDSEEV